MRDWIWNESFPKSPFTDNCTFKERAFEFLEKFSFENRDSKSFVTIRAMKTLDSYGSLSSSKTRKNLSSLIQRARQQERSTFISNCKISFIEAFDELPKKPEKSNPQKLVEWVNDPKIQEMRELILYPRKNNLIDRWTTVVSSSLKIGNKDPKGKLAQMSGVEAFVLFAVQEYLNGRPQIDKSAKVNHDRWWQLALCVRKDIERYKKKLKKEGKDIDCFMEGEVMPSNPDELVIDVSSSEDERDEDKENDEEYERENENEYGKEKPVSNSSDTENQDVIAGNL